METKGTGTASFTFEEPSDVYSIRVTYFDGDNGQSRITLRVAGVEKAAFALDEDVDCWRWRLFENIQVNKGDTITLVGEADEDETAILDFIDFIPRTAQ